MCWLNPKVRWGSWEKAVIFQFGSSSQPGGRDVLERPETELDGLEEFEAEEVEELDIDSVEVKGPLGEADSDSFWPFGAAAGCVE